MLNDSFIFRFPRQKEWSPVLVNCPNYGNRLEDIVRYYFEKDYLVDLEPIDALATLENRPLRQDEYCMPDYKMVGVDPESPLRETFLLLGDACVDVKITDSGINRSKKCGFEKELKHMKNTNTHWYIFAKPIGTNEFKKGKSKYILFRSDLERDLDI